MPQAPVLDELDAVPTRLEVREAVRSLQNGRSPGEDGIPAEVFKHGGELMMERLNDLIVRIWHEEAVPDQLKNAVVVTIFKKKGSRSDCGNHRGISLLSVASKVLTKIMSKRLLQISEGTLSESQCGFRRNRGTVDMIFAARQLQEKCREQNKPLYAVFIDLTKAFDTVSRTALWEILKKQGVPQLFLNVLQQLHDGMQGRVSSNGEVSEAFSISNGVKQGCVIAPSLFALFFHAMLQEAFKDCSEGVSIQFRCDGSVFNLARLRAKTKVQSALLRELLYADDCGLFAHSEEELQVLMDRFTSAANNFGLTISIKKTEVMFQAAPYDRTASAPMITVDGEQLTNCDQFTYLGSVLSADCQLDKEISQRIGKASASFGALRQRVWKSHDISLKTKVALYRACVISVLTYGCESWTLYRRQIDRLEAFHHRCLRKILRISWREHVTNLEVLQRAGAQSLEAMLRRSTLRWAGHVARQDESRIPKQLFYGQLSEGKRRIGKPLKRFKDGVRETLGVFGMAPTALEDTAQQRSKWRAALHDGCERFEEARTERIEQIRERRKYPELAKPTGYTCHVCARPCGSGAGLAAHVRARHHRTDDQH